MILFFAQHVTIVSVHPPPRLLLLAIKSIRGKKDKLFKKKKSACELTACSVVFHPTSGMLPLHSGGFNVLGFFFSPYLENIYTFSPSLECLCVGTCATEQRQF